MIPIDSIKIPSRFVRVASHWYSGMSDMLYAVSSTGGLTLGTTRPVGCETDEQWYLTIWRDLSVDTACALRAAYEVRESNNPEVDDYGDLWDFNKWVNGIVERLEESYNLVGWLPE